MGAHLLSQAIRQGGLDLELQLPVQCYACLT